MTKTGKTHTGDLWWALKATEPEPVPHPPPAEPMSTVDHVTEPLSAAIATMCRAAEEAGWEVKVTRAVGTVMHKTGKPGALVESFGVRMRGPWERPDHDRWGTAHRRAAVAVYHRKMRDATATFESGWWWRVDHRDHALTVPLAAGATALMPWIRFGEEPSRVEESADTDGDT